MDQCCTSENRAELKIPSCKMESETLKHQLYFHSNCQEKNIIHFSIKMGWLSKWAYSALIMPMGIRMCVSSIVKIYLIFTHSCDLKIITEQKVWMRFRIAGSQLCNLHYFQLCTTFNWRTAKWQTLLYLKHVKSKNYLPFLTNVRTFTICVWYLDSAFFAVSSRCNYGRKG
jgi:hypothetical protein